MELPVAFSEIERMERSDEQNVIITSERVGSIFSFYFYVNLFLQKINGRSPTNLPLLPSFPRKPPTLHSRTELLEAILQRRRQHQRRV